MDGGSVWTFRTLPDFRWQKGLRRFFQQEFFVQAPQLQAGRQLVAELDDADIEKREAAFNRMSHPHPITLRTEQVL